MEEIAVIYTREYAWYKENNHDRDQISFVE